MPSESSTSNFPRSYVLTASLISCLDDPGVAGAEAVLSIKDGALVVEDGHIAGVHAADSIPEAAKSLPIFDRSGFIVCPGFVDTHVHYPQAGMIGSHGTQLLDWLERYTFPEEARFSDAAYADQVARIFLDELLNNGTTSALVFSSVHKNSTDSLFRAALVRDMRLIAGKAMMDRNVPESVRDTAQSSIRDTESLIRDWQGVQAAAKRGVTA